MTVVIDNIKSDYSESLEFLNEKLPLEASQPIRDRITELKIVIESLKKLKDDLTDISSAELEDLPGKVNVLCETTGAGRRKRAAGGGCEITDEMKLEVEGRVVSIESIGSISSNLNRRILERLTIKRKIAKIVKHLGDLDGVSYGENINDIELLLDLQNSYLDSVPSAIDLHRSKNRHNGAVLDEETEQWLNRLESKALEGREQNAGLMNSVTALKDSIFAFEKIRKIKERLNPELLKDLSKEEINSLIDGELEKVEAVKKELARIIEVKPESIVRTVIKNKFEQEIQRVNKKVSDIQSFASLMQEIDRFDITKKSLYESTREINSEGITYGKKVNDLRDELFSNIIGLIDDFNNLQLDPNLIKQAPDFIKERVKVFKNDISYLKSVKADVSTTKSFSIDELFDYISPSIRDDRAIGESLELSQIVMSYKRLRAVTYFFENGFDVNTRDSNGRTFLHLVAEMGGDESLISLLLEKGAMFDAKDNDGKSPLDLLHKNAIKLDIGEVNLLESIERAFHFVGRGDFDSVNNLLKESSEDYIRALVKTRNSSGNTLLYEAVAKEQANQESQVRIIELLIKNGAADGLQDPNGESILYVAIKNKGEKVDDIMEVSLEAILPEELEQPSVSNITSQSIEEGPLAKPIYDEKFLGAAQSSTAEYSNVFKESSSASTTKLPLEIEFQKRTNDKSPIYKENIASSAARTSSFINDLFGWVKGSIGGLFNSRAALPSGPAQQKDFQGSDEKRNPGGEFCEQFSPKACVQNNIAAFNLLLQTVLDRKCPLPKWKSINEEEALAYALNITTEFEQILNCTALNCGISAQNLTFNNWKIQSTIRIQVLNNEKGKIFETLCLAAEKACPNLTQREAFLTEVEKQLVRSLEYTDIINLAKTKYGYNSKNSGFLCNNKKEQQLFSVVEAGAQLTNTLKKFKAIGRKGEGERLTLIINTRDNHWVTLVVPYKTRECYYADSLCQNIPEDIRQSLNASGIRNVKNVSTLQQRDTYNYSIFALENAQSINSAIDRNPREIKRCILQNTCSLEEIGEIRTNHAATNFYGAKDLPPNDVCTNTPRSFLSSMKMTDYANNLACR